VGSVHTHETSVGEGIRSRKAKKVQIANSFASGEYIRRGLGPGARVRTRKYLD